MTFVECILHLRKYPPVWYDAKPLMVAKGWVIQFTRNEVKYRG